VETKLTNRSKSRLAKAAALAEIEATVLARELPPAGGVIYGALLRARDGRLRFDPFARDNSGAWVEIKTAMAMMKLGRSQVYRLAEGGVLARKRRKRNRGMRVSVGSVLDWLRAQ
jgi:hypothetical protein